MILAKRCLQVVGFMVYDHYNGRYLRNIYTKRMQHMQEFEVIASARATLKAHPPMTYLPPEAAQ